MENKKITAVKVIGRGHHIHSENCADIDRNPQYAMTRKFKNDLDVLKSPFEEYSDLEFTILAEQVGVKPNGCPSEIELNNCDVRMIGPNQYIFVDWDGEDVRNYDYLSHDEDGNRNIYSLKDLQLMCGLLEWEEVKVFPCTHKNTKKRGN